MLPDASSTVRRGRFLGAESAQGGVGHSGGAVGTPGAEGGDGEAEGGSDHEDDHPRDPEPGRGGVHLGVLRWAPAYEGDAQGPCPDGCDQGSGSGEQ